MHAQEWSLHIKGLCTYAGFPGGTADKESAWDTRDSSSIFGQGSSLERGHGNPLQYSYLDNPWIEEPGGLQSMGSQRIWHDWATEHACVHACTHVPVIFHQQLILNLIKTLCIYCLILYLQLRKLNIRTLTQIVDLGESGFKPGVALTHTHTHTHTTNTVVINC